jgi:Arrestin (or S-antigen), N-terminal domain
VEVRHVDIQVKGKEKGSFVDTVYETIEENGVQRTETKHEKRKRERDIFYFSAPCFTFSTPVLNAGDYAIPFTFQVPSGLPSSLLYSNKHHAKKPKAKVKYTVRAVLQGHHGSVMKYKQVLVLREIPPQAEA